MDEVRATILQLSELHNPCLFAMREDKGGELWRITIRLLLAIMLSLPPAAATAASCLRRREDSESSACLV
jgi:hypothetical protein